MARKGPHKTASTTLQVAITQTFRERLHCRDGFVIPSELPGEQAGCKNHANIAFALLSASKPVENSSTWISFVNAVQAARANQSRLLVSAEDLCRLDSSRAQLFVSTLLKAGFAAVRVIIVYRRLYDKLASLHSERCMGSPLAVSEYVPIDRWVVRNATDVRRLYSQTVLLYNMYGTLGAKITVLNMHAATHGTSLLREFICEHVRAENTCSHLKSLQNASDAVQENVRTRSVAPLFDLIYAAARARGIHTLKDPKALVGILAEQDYANLPGKRFLKRCLSAEAQQRILHATVEEERALASYRGELLSAQQLRLIYGDFAIKSKTILCGAEVGAAAKRKSAWSQPLALAFRQAAL